MRLIEIEQQLRQFLPLHTDRFNDWMDATFSVVGDVATVVTSEAHGLSVGSYSNITDVVFRNPLVNLKSVDGTGSASTTIQNDLTNGFQDSIEIQDANEAVFNNVFTSFKSLNRTQFTFPVEPFDTTDGTGAAVLLEPNLERYTGMFQVASIVDDNTYTIAVAGEADFVSDCRSANENSRIAVAFNSDQALSYYTKQKTGDYWAFVLPNATQVSKQREGNHDFNYINKDGEYTQDLLRTFSILVLGKTNTEESCAEIMDECFVDIADALRKSLINYSPRQTTSQKTSAIAYDEDEPAHYDNAIYGHMYGFTCSVQLKNKDGFNPQSSAARRVITDYKDNATNNKLTIAKDTLELKES
jgi:hypothetical protein